MPIWETSIKRISSAMTSTYKPNRPGPSLWHHLKADIHKALDAGYQTGQDFDEALLPWAQCGICRGEIILPGIPPLDTDSRYHKMNMWIMRCGHMCCYSCGLSYQNCELCRDGEKFLSPTCGHPSRKFVLPSQFETLKTAPDLRTLINLIPKTLPEGGTVPSHCQECYRSPDEKDYKEMSVSLSSFLTRTFHKWLEMCR